MKYAIIKTGGNQYKVSEGEEPLVDNLGLEEGKKVSFTEVLLLVDEDNVKIGDPLVKGASVEAKILGNLKGKKIRVARFQAKSRSRTVRGYRHSYSKVIIEEIKAS